MTIKTIKALASCALILVNSLAFSTESPKIAIESVSSSVTDHDLQKLDDYFKGDENAIVVPIGALRTVKHDEPAKSINNAMRYLIEASQGLRDKRAPVTVVHQMDANGNPNGIYTVVDGNATTHALARMGAGFVRVVDVGEDRLTRLRNSVYVAKEENAKEKIRTEGLGDLIGEAAREKAYELAEVNIAMLNEITQEAADAVGAGVGFRPVNKAGDGVDEREVGKSIKRRARVDEKVLNDYNGDYARCIDLIGTTIFMPDSGDYSDVIKKIRKACEARGARIAKVKFLNMKPDSKGYGDIKVSIRFENGTIGEVIIVEEYVYGVKSNRGGHVAYEISRMLEKYKEYGDEAINEAWLKITDLSEAIYERGPQALNDEAFEAVKTSALSSLAILLEKPDSPLSDVDSNLLDELSVKLQRAAPPSTDSYATPTSPFIWDEESLEPGELGKPADDKPCFDRAEYVFDMFVGMHIGEQYEVNNKLSEKILLRKVGRGKLPSGIRLRYDRKLGKVVLSGAPRKSGTYEYVVRPQEGVGLKKRSGVETRFVFVVKDLSKLPETDRNYNAAAGKKIKTYLSMLTFDGEYAARLSVYVTSKGAITAKIKGVAKKQLVFKGYWRNVYDGAMVASLYAKTGETLNIVLMKDGNMWGLISNLASKFGTVLVSDNERH